MEDEHVGVELDHDVGIAGGDSGEGAGDAHDCFRAYQLVTLREIGADQVDVLDFWRIIPGFNDDMAPRGRIGQAGAFD